MRADEDRHALRVTFDAVAGIYDRYREVAPAEVFDDLVALTGLVPGAHVLEIGCGTGQATRPLAERGFAVTGIELGASLAEQARRNLAGFPDVTVVTGAFEDWDPGDAQFDAVVSFNAFHWLDEDVRFAKPAAVLREGGHLVVLGSRFIEHDEADPVWLATQEDFAAATGEPEERPHADALPDRSAEFAEAGYFHPAARNLYRWDVTYDADAYIGLLRTISSYTTLDDDVRKDLFARVHRRISACATGTVTPTVAAVLYVARRA